MEQEDFEFEEPCEEEPYEPEPIEWWEVAPRKPRNILDEDREAMEHNEAKAELSSRFERNPYER